MAKEYVVMISSYGYATIEAETSDEAIMKATKLKKEEIDWSDNWGTSDCEIVEEEDE